jgi:hypothetical protein
MAIRAEMRNIETYNDTTKGHIVLRVSETIGNV